jgi:hypothetical protein
LTPTIQSRCRSIALRAAGTSTRLMSISSPSLRMPVRAMFSRIRTRFGAPFATVTTSSM